MGFDSTGIISADGELWAWGSLWGLEASGGSAGTPTKIDLPWKISNCAWGNQVRLHISNTSQLLVSGRQDALGLNTTDNTGLSPPIVHPLIAITPKSIASGAWASNLVVATDGSVWGFGDNHWAQLGIGYASAPENPYVILPTKNPLLANIESCSVGIFHGACFDKFGRLFVFGQNSVCQNCISFI